MKKTKSILKLFITLIILSGTGFVFAGSEGENTCTTGEVCFQNPIKANNLEEFFKDLLQIFASVGTIFVVLALIYSGFLLVTARGNEQQLTTGKKALMWTVIGGAVVLGAWAISLGIANTIKEITN